VKDPDVYASSPGISVVPAMNSSMLFTPALESMILT
jgi:hypothetical protein